MESTALQQPLRWGFFSLCRMISAPMMTTLTGVRHINVPDTAQLSGCMLASNHQSYLDPVLVGMALGRPINYLARSQLFDLPVFSTLIKSLGAHPVRQGTADSRALRTVIGLLRHGEPVLLFPEGTRTQDGTVGSFQPGIASIADRCSAPVIPVCIEGAFRSWPRNRILPSPARIGVMYGEPIQPLGGRRDEFMAVLCDKITAMKKELRAIMGR